MSNMECGTVAAAPQAVEKLIHCAAGNSFSIAGSSNEIKVYLTKNNPRFSRRSRPTGFELMHCLFIVVAVINRLSDGSFVPVDDQTSSKSAEPHSTVLRGCRHFMKCRSFPISSRHYLPPVHLDLGQRSSLFV